jgi:large subunit ribosomal protein L25
MADTGVLKARVRDLLGTVPAQKLRRQGKVPAVIYGPGFAPRHVWVDHLELKKEIELGRRILSLTVENEEHMTMVKELQMDLYQENIIHADFLKVDETTAVEMNVPIVIQGVPLGEKEGGKPMQTVRDLLIQCPASAVPSAITLDVSSLDVGDSLTVGDISLPEGVSTNLDSAILVYIVHAPVAEESETAPEEIKEPEIIGRDKKEEEEE